MLSKSFVLTAKNVNDFTRVVFYLVCSSCLRRSCGLLLCWVVLHVGVVICMLVHSVCVHIVGFHVSVAHLGCCSYGFSSCGLFFMWVVLHVGGVSCGVFFVWVILHVVVLYVCRGHVFNVRVVWFIPFVDT